MHQPDMLETNGADTATNESIIFNDAVTATIGGVEYPIVPLKIRASRQWRLGKFMPIAERLVRCFEAALKAQSKDQTVDLADLAALAAWLTTEAPEMVLDALYAYAPNIAADSARIEEEAFDHEIAAAFVEVVKVAFPLGKIGEALGARKK